MLLLKASKKKNNTRIKNSFNKYLWQVHMNAQLQVYKQKLCSRVQKTHMHIYMCIYACKWKKCVEITEKAVLNSNWSIFNKYVH